MFRFNTPLVVMSLWAIYIIIIKTRKSKKNLKYFIKKTNKQC